jgi:hypothetical protein
MNRIVSIAAAGVRSLGGFAAIAIALVAGLSGSSARAATVLVDFGNNTSFRGASVTNPDQNGNNWNSMQPGLFYTNLIDTTGTGTGINFGFSTPVGTDSFNGPAGATSNSPLTPAEIAAADIDQAALGNLGVKAAAVDFAAETNCRFEIQALNPLKKYNLKFFGSHKFSTSDATSYSVYTDNTYTTLVASGLLNVQTPGSPNLHNRDTTLTLSNLSPQTSNILYVQFTGATGGFGYLNSMAITDVVPEPTCGVAVCGLAGLVAAHRRRRPGAK